MRRHLILSCACLSFAVLGAALPARSQTLSQKVQTERLFGGLCDGSAAVLINDRTLLVGNDETNNLTTYDIWGGKPIASASLNEMLGLIPVKSKFPEIDIEAAFVHSDGIWWIGSHGLDGDAEDAPSRRALFETNVPRSDLSDLKVTNTSIDLLPVLLESELTRPFFSSEVLKRAPKKGGVNIEGMALDQSGNLVLGFRSPLSSDGGQTGHALLVRLSKSGEDYQVVSADLLDLGNRGFRDIIAVDDLLFFIAGPVNKGEQSAVFRWDGVNPPVDLQLKRMAKFNSEALLLVGQNLFVLSDDGRAKRRDSQAGDGKRGCTKIYKKNTQHANHPNVFFRGRAFKFN